MRKLPMTPSIIVTPVPSVQPVGIRCSKRTKTTLDPYIRTSKRTRTDMHQKTMVHCSQCNKEDHAEMLLSCKSKCSNKIHLACVQITYPEFGKKGERTWHCKDCQTCNMCKEGVSANTTLQICHQCFKSVHPKCDGVTVDDEIQFFKENRFRCKHCTNSPPKPNEKGNSRSKRITRKKTLGLEPVSEIVSRDVRASSEGEDFYGFSTAEVEPLPINIRRPEPVQPMPVAEVLNTNADKSINRDISKWSTSDVYEYFAKKFPLHAHVFEDEEIDGRALLLLTRQIFLQRFKIKVGPSLIIYEHILKLQNNNL